MEPTQPAPLTIELSAVILEPDRQFALFRQAAQGTLLRAEVGQDVDGWVVREIRADGVSLERGGERQDLALRTFKAPARRAPPVRARAPNPVSTAKQAIPPSAKPRRPRRPLRGPRRRSIQRRGAVQQ